MNKKPVFFHDAGKIINLTSGFSEKLLCDGPTFSTGSACVYSCSFCYVPSTLTNLPPLEEAKRDGKAFEDIVIRRTDVLNRVRNQLTLNGKPRFDASDKRVIYASPLVDVAANIELAKETVEVCKLILSLTNWQIRLLSKSNLLPYIAENIPSEHNSRMIYGVSTGTMDDGVAKAFEGGTALVSKRIASLHKLQSWGCRTFAMICPSLPHTDYKAFSKSVAASINLEACEHIWGEVINVRGESMVRTCNALTTAGYATEAELLHYVSTNTAAWEEYSRATFLAHVTHFPKDKLRFLQYVTPTTVKWWEDQIPNGAVVLRSRMHAPTS